MHGLEALEQMFFRLVFNGFFDSFLDFFVGCPASDHFPQRIFQGTEETGQ